MLLINPSPAAHVKPFGGHIRLHRSMQANHRHCISSVVNQCAQLPQANVGGRASDACAAAAALAQRCPALEPFWNIITATWGGH